MPRVRSEVNRSEAIREAFKELPNAKAKEIVAHLKGKGVEVTEGLVYQVKKVSKRKRKLSRKAAQVPQVKSLVAAPAKTVAVSSNGRLGVGASIAVAKAAAEKVGGWAALKEIVDALA
jgi:ribosomal protein S8